MLHVIEIILGVVLGLAGLWAFGMYHFDIEARRWNDASIDFLAFVLAVAALGMLLK